MATYNWQQKDWPNFQYSLQVTDNELFMFAETSGKIKGILGAKANSLVAKTVIRRMLEEGPGGFQGGMNASKYTGITKASKATATRDLQDLLAMGAIALLGEAGGRSTSYRGNL